MWALPDDRPLLQQPAAHGIEVRRALPPEKTVLCARVRSHFNERWVGEVEVALSRQPASCTIANTTRELLGFACYDAACRGFFGPTGVLDPRRSRAPAERRSRRHCA